MEELITGAIVTLVLGLYKLMEMLIKKLGNGKNSETGLLTLEQHQKLDDLHAWHNVNIDGRKAWYNTEEQFNREKEMADIMHQTSRLQKEILEIVKQHGKVLQEILILLERLNK